MSLFSIVTICKNDLVNLKKTIDSVQMQNFKDFEYVICDGASNDGSVEHIEQMGVDKYVSEPDNGIYDAMNKALKLCSGGYVCFMNAGDVFYDKYVLTEIAKKIEIHPYIPFFYGDVIYPIFRRYYIRNRSSLTNFLLFRAGVCHQSWFLSREIYNEIGGFNTSFQYEADIDILLKIIIEKKIPYKHLSLCVAKYKGEGFSLSNMKAREEEREIIRKKHFTPKQIYWFTIWVKIINIIRKIPVYEGMMSIFSRSYWFYLQRKKAGR